MVEVVNMHKCYPPWGQQGDIRVDRGSTWGNPFPIGSCVENGVPISYTRDGCIQRYRQYFNSGETVNVNGKVWDASEAQRRFPELLKAHRLGCWCKPQACHGDLLKTAVDKYHATHGGSYEQVLKPREIHKIDPTKLGITSKQQTLQSGSYINDKGELVKTYKRKKKLVKPKTKRKCRCKK